MSDVNTKRDYSAEYMRTKDVRKMRRERKAKVRSAIVLLPWQDAVRRVNAMTDFPRKLIMDALQSAVIFGYKECGIDDDGPYFVRDNNLVIHLNHEEVRNLIIGYEMRRSQGARI